MAVYLSPHNTPRIVVDVQLASYVQIDCIIDTGFTGGIALPIAYQSAFGKDPSIYQQYQMADGSYTTFKLYTAAIRYNGKVREMTILFTNATEALVGIEFLQGFVLTMDLKRMKISLV